MTMRPSPLLAAVLCSPPPRPTQHRLAGCYVARAVEAFDQPGLAVACAERALVWSKGYGKLDLAKPETGDAPIRSSTAPASARLHRVRDRHARGQGKLSFDDPVRKTCPGSARRSVRGGEHDGARLLCHRSGWITFDGDLLWYGTAYSQREILDRHAREPLTHASAMSSGTAI